MVRILKICIIFFILMINLYSCVYTNTKYSNKCGKYIVLNHQTLLFDTIYIFDPIELKEKRFVIKTYTEKNFHIVCRDTLDGGSLIYEIGTLENKSGKFLLSEQKVEYHPFE